MREIKTWAVLLFGAALMAGCNKQAASGGDTYVPRKKAPLPSAMLDGAEVLTYFPLAAGNQWTYTFQEQRMMNDQTATSKPFDITYRISKVTPDAKGKFAIIDIVKDDVVQEKQVWRVDQSGIYQVAIGKQLSRYSSPQPVVKFPAKAGNKFSWTGTGKTTTNEIGKSTINATVVGEEEIDTGVGTFNALTVETKGTASTGKVQAKTVSRVWFVPKVGIARYRQETLGKTRDGKTIGQIQLLKLKTYSLKNS